MRGLRTYNQHFFGKNISPLLLSVECTREFMTRDMNVTMNPKLGTAAEGGRRDFDFNLISR